MGILKFEDYTINSSILSLIKEFENIDINESSNNNHLNDIVNTLNLNENIIDIYNSVNFDVLFNIVKELISNDSLNVELNDKNITQSTLSLILISLKNDIEKTNNLKYYNSVDDLKNDIRDILEELKLEGIGNGIIKKISTILEQIYDFFKLISKDIKINNIKTLFDIISNDRLSNIILSPIYNYIKKNNVSMNSLEKTITHMNKNTSVFSIEPIINAISKSFNTDIEIDIHDSDISNKNNDIINEQDK
jgi:hypothetical protein